MEELAALIDGRLPTAEAARVRAHLASCEDCYEVFAETLHLQEELRRSEGGVVLFPFEGRRKVRPLWAAAVAAVLVAGVGVGLWHLLGTPDLSVAVLSKQVAGRAAEPAKAAWTDAMRGGAEDKDTAGEKLSFQSGVAVFNLQVALDRNDERAANSAASQVCRVLGISREQNRPDAPLKSSQVPFLDQALTTFYGELPGKLVQGAPGSFASEAAAQAEALRQAGSLDKGYFDLGAWAEAGRLAALSKKPALSRRKEAEYLLGQLLKERMPTSRPRS